MREAGLAGEEHHVVTPDGYILALHRVTRPGPHTPPTARRKVVFLQHGLFCSSAVWVIGDRAKAFGKHLIYFLSFSKYSFLTLNPI